ncbi:hypothetical protein AVEN_182168-1, partial [Araneus ventricosus]
MTVSVKSSLGLYVFPLDFVNLSSLTKLSSALFSTPAASSPSPKCWLLFDNE